MKHSAFHIHVSEKISVKNCHSVNHIIEDSIISDFLDVGAGSNTSIEVWQSRLNRD